MASQLFAPTLCFFCAIVWASGHRQVVVHHNVEGAKHVGNAGNAVSSPPVERFIEAFKLAFRAAHSPLPSKDGKRVVIKDASGKNVTIKQWADTNKAFKHVRDAIIPSGYGSELVDKVFADTIRQQFGDSGKVEASKSGSKIFAFDYDQKTKHAYLLKSEDRDEVYEGLVHVQDQYAKSIEPMGACRASVMMKVLLVFEPLDVDASVNKKVWTLLTNVNPFPSREGNTVAQYDLKHSREKNLCHASEDVGVGFLGDFLRDFGLPLRDAIKEQEPWQKATEGGRDANVTYKTTCLTNAIARDLAALDSGYPEVKLVDQSLLIFAVRPKDDIPTVEEMEIASAHNNVITVRKGDEYHFLVFGLIDLFAAKKAGKKFEAYTTSDSLFLFNQGKFSLYPFNLFCVSQLVLGYTDFQADGTMVPVHDPGRVWNCLDEHLIDSIIKHTIGQLSSKDVTRQVHEWFKHTNSHMCSIVATCDAVLRDETVRENLHHCCEDAALNSTGQAGQCPF